MFVLDPKYVLFCFLLCCAHTATHSLWSLCLAAFSARWLCLPSGAILLGGSLPGAYSLCMPTRGCYATCQGLLHCGTAVVVVAIAADRLRRLSLCCFFVFFCCCQISVGFVP